MEVRYSNQPIENIYEKSAFLVGPTPRSKDVPSWRPIALEYLKDKFDGVILVPEPEGGERFPGYDNQISWEYHYLNACDAIIAWVPRNMENMIGLTTNCEIGYWLAKNPKKLYYGRPDGAPHTSYLDWMYYKETGRIPQPTLESLLNEILFVFENS